MRRRLACVISVLLSTLASVYAEPKASTPTDGKTYYIYNVEMKQYLADNGNGTATLSKGGTPITVNTADKEADTYYMTTENGRLSTPLIGDVMTNSTGKYDQWRFESASTEAEGFYISCRVREANAFMYLTWSKITDKVTKTPWQPGDTFYGGRWIFVAESDYSENIVVLDENATEYTVPSVEYASTVQLKRTMTLNSWNSFCVPFNINSTQLRTAFGDDVHTAEFTGCNETTLMFTTVIGIEAGKPYIIRPTKDRLSSGYYEFTGIGTFTSEPADITQDMVTCKGFFHKTTAPQGAYVLRKNEVYHLQSDMEMKGFRAYFIENAGEKPKISLWTLDSGTTSIDGITEQISISSDIYNTTGQRVRTNKAGIKGLVRGIYIVNGKKVVIK